MPHAQSLPSTGFQALILCGPGVSLNTFTSSPNEFPKALVPLANRPMVWYALDWCHRMGVTNIHLVTPASSAAAIEAALSTNPHLTSLPLPKADILSSEGLSHNSGTAEIFRLPEVQAAITGDFIVLPCDLVCEPAGTAFLEAWMTQQIGLENVTCLGESEHLAMARIGLSPERSLGKGGLGVWYDTKGGDVIKGEETDFIASTPLPPPTVTPSHGSLLPHISKLVYSAPTDTINDITSEKKSFPIRHSLLRKHGRIKMLSTHRDAHIYFFPHWILSMIQQNEKFDSLSEDVVGWWAKASWQIGLPEKLGLRYALESPSSTTGGEDALAASEQIEDQIDLSSMSTTWTSNLKPLPERPNSPRLLASRIPAEAAKDITPPKRNTTIPPILAYVHPSGPHQSIIRRCDTTPLLLHLSLRLARLPSHEDIDPTSTSPATPPHPFAHRAKITHAHTIAPRSTVTKADCLLADNVVVEEKCVVKECVLGAGCKIERGARLTRCVLMEDVVVGERAQLSGCVIGRRSVVGRESVLRDCEVQEGYAVAENTDAKNEKFMIFEGLDEDGGGVMNEGDGTNMASTDDDLEEPAP